MRNQDTNPRPGFEGADLARRDFRFFAIRFGHQDAMGRYGIEAISSMGKPVTARWKSPLTAAELEELSQYPALWGWADAASPPSLQGPVFRDLQAASDPKTPDSPSFETKDDLGRRLFDSLFEGPVERLYLEDLGRSGSDLCLVLELDPRDNDQLKLYSLPWELLREEGRDPLVLLGRPVVRRLVVPHEDPPTPEIGRLKILAVPVNDTKLDLGAETELLSAIGDASEGFDVKILEKPPSIFELRRALEAGDYHVLHVMGHGCWSEENRAYALELAGETYSAEQLSLLLASAAKSLRLVMLNTCHSGRAVNPERAGIDIGIATALMSRGAVAIVANRASITDSAARILCRGFYERLAQGWPVATALNASRVDLYGLQDRKQGVARGEWATPMLLVRSLKSLSGGGLFEPGAQPAPRKGLLMSTALLLACGILLTSAFAWLAHSLEQLVAMVGLSYGVIRLLWSWWRQLPQLPDPTRALAKHLVRWPKTSTLAVGSLFFVSVWVGLDSGTSRLAAFPCLEKAPYGRDPTRWGVGYSFDSEVEPGWEDTWVDDLRSELARHGFDPIPIGSEQDLSLEPGCLAWRIEAVGRRNNSGETNTLVRVGRRGAHEALIHRPSAPGEIQEGVAKELRQILGIATIPLSAVSTDPESLEANRQGLTLYLAGDLGAAEERLARAVERDHDNPKLRNNLALVLFDLALQRRLRTESCSGDPSKARRQIEELLDRALRHLDRAIAEDAGNASYHYDRGRILQFLERPAQAEEAFEEALRSWPTFPEAANDLAALLLDGGKPSLARRASTLLETALAFVAPEDRRTRAAILKNLGRAHWALGNLDAAWQTLDAADCMVRRETSDDPLDSEILTLSAALQADLLGPASAAVTWRRYGSILARDTNVERRRHFFDWRMSHLHRPGQLSDMDLWVGRCLEGHFESLGLP